MGKKRDSLNLFKESIDPRFCGLFNTNKNNGKEKDRNDFQSSTNIETVNACPKVKENAGFQKFIGTKLAEYLETHMKEVDRPVVLDEFFTKKIESIYLFSDSHLITEEEPVELVQQKPPKKKRKEKRDKESLKDVAVTYEWLQKQAQMLKS